MTAADPSTSKQSKCCTPMDNFEADEETVVVGPGVGADDGEPESDGAYDGEEDGSNVGRTPGV
eukprot:CAMPEP_0194030700 /NCGR_PEP_ID=MMETSP0009_2-20130614/4079_1 /TAXON_ID=210454 /ORGANISM="Grammatophora oceanica, Strain CCMP 410" /LENGTH=62 /DNA_ID=CAMNT_0038670685 /DNA_START=164 /DNA_END=352 /DNA_ORIENTATION=+